MFNSISWQEFLYATGLVVAGYYLIAALLLYYRELTSIFNQKQPKEIASSQHDNQNAANESIDLVGGIKPETPTDASHESFIEADEIKPQLPQEDDAISQAHYSIQHLELEAASDLLRAAKTIVIDLLDENEDQIALLFQHLLAQYPQLTNTPYQEAISHFLFTSIKANSKAVIELSDIKSWLLKIENVTEN